MRILFRVVLVLFVVIALSAIAYYIEIPYNINTKGIIMPVREWNLLRLSDGTILNSEKNNLTNKISYYSVLEFQRGDHAEFMVNEKVFNRKTIDKGDTIGYIRSFEEERRLLGLLTGLEEQRGLLRISLSGEKEEEINAARARLGLAEQEYETQKKLVARMEALHKTGIIADEAWEVARNDYLVTRQNINIAQAALDMVSSGAKPEERELIRTNINSFLRQIEQTENRMDAFNILAPFSGIIIREQRPETNGNTIIRVADMDNLMVTFPVDIFQLIYIEDGNPINIRINSGRRSYSGRVIDADNSVQFIDQRQKVFVTALIDDNPGMFIPNMLVQAEILCGSISGWAYLRRMFKTVFEN